MKLMTHIEINSADTMNNIILELISKHESTKDKRMQLSTSHKNMLRRGLLKVKKCLSNTLKMSTIQDSFALTGMYPLSLDRTLGKCPSERSGNVDNLIRELFRI